VTAQTPFQESSLLSKYPRSFALLENNIFTGSSISQRFSPNPELFQTFFYRVQDPVDLPQDSTTAAYGQVTLEDATAHTIRDRVPYDIAFDGMTQLQLEPMLPLDLTGEFQAAEEDITMAPEPALDDMNLLETAEFELEGR